jgi:type II secretory pathway component PulF
MSAYEQSQQPQASPRALINESAPANDYAPRSRPNAAFGGGAWAISAKELIGLCQRVGQSLKAGVEIRRVWKQEASRGSSTHRRHMEHIVRAVSAGGNVADAMRECGGYLPPLTCQMVEIGEKTGQLDEVLLRLAKYYEQQVAMQRTFWIGIAWPGLQLFAGVIVIAGVIWITGMITSMTGMRLDILGLGLTGGYGALLFLGSVLTMIGGIVLTVTALLRGWLGPMPMRIAMRLPVIGGCLEAFALSRLTWSFALGLESGMDARRVVELAIAATQNANYEQHSAAISAGVGRGQTFYESFQQTHAFPDDFLFALESAEIAGVTSESLLRLTNQYEQKASDSLRILTMAASALTWVTIALVIILAIVRLAMFVFQPYYEAIDMINSGKI